MKKFIISIIITGILSIICVANCYSFTGQVDLGYHTNSANDTADTLFLAEAEHEENKIAIDMSSKLHQQQDKIKNDVDFLGNIQLNYKPDQFYYFANSQYGRDTANGIQDRVDLGIGVGYEFFPNSIYPRFKMQTGAYRRSGDEEQFIVKGKLDYFFRIWGPFILREQAGADIDTELLENYYLMADTGLQVELSERVTFGVGLEYSRDGQPVFGYDKDVRKWRSTIGVRF